MVDAKKVYDNGEAIKIPTKVSELENDSNFISANGDMDIKATIMFDFDAGKHTMIGRKSLKKMV